MDCKECNSEMEMIDTTYSNINTPRAYKGQYTGDIYKCEKCELFYLDNFLNGELEIWNY